MERTKISRHEGAWHLACSRNCPNTNGDDQWQVVMGTGAQEGRGQLIWHLAGHDKVLEVYCE